MTVVLDLAKVVKASVEKRNLVDWQHNTVGVLDAKVSIKDFFRQYRSPAHGLVVYC